MLRGLVIEVAGTRGGRFGGRMDLAGFEEVPLAHAVPGVRMKSSLKRAWLMLPGAKVFFAAVILCTALAMRADLPGFVPFWALRLRVWLFRARTVA
jgi:hypothetical protein